jgi:hypothetical protein
MPRSTILTLAAIADLLCWFSLGFLFTYSLGAL